MLDVFLKKKKKVIKLYSSVHNSVLDEMVQRATLAVL